jgi:hypothetical protein
MACCSSECILPCIQTTAQWNSSIYLGIPSEWDIYTYIFSCLEWPILWPPRILTLPPEAFCISPSNGVANYTPRHRIPFSSPSTTRKVTVEVFKPASTRALTHWFACPVGPRGTASGGTAQKHIFLQLPLRRTAQKTPIPAVLLILRVSTVRSIDIYLTTAFTEQFPSNCRIFWLHTSGSQQTCENTCEFCYCSV